MDLLVVELAVVGSLAVFVILGVVAIREQRSAVGGLLSVGFGGVIIAEADVFGRVGRAAAVGSAFSKGGRGRVSWALFSGVEIAVERRVVGLGYGRGERGAGRVAGEAAELGG